LKLAIADEDRQVADQKTTTVPGGEISAASTSALSSTDRVIRISGSAAGASLFGGAVGASVGGPIGAMVGAIIGGATSGGMSIMEAIRYPKTESPKK
jgi:outer membrane lipoprotein SlyB